MSLITVLTAVSSPSPTGPAASAVDVEQSNYWLAVGLLIAAIVVIVLALLFAWLYHRDALRTIEKLATVEGGPPVAIDSSGAVERGLVVGPAIVGSSTGYKDAALMFTVEDLPSGAEVAWDVEGASVEEIDGGRTIRATFAKDGIYEVKAIVKDAAAGTESPLKSKEVTIQSPGPVKASSPPLVIPFVVKNWGRLVIVLFGVGVISALMAIQILDAAAGVGVLGTLLGAGAVSATTGSSADPPAQRPAGTTGAGGSGGDGS